MLREPGRTVIRITPEVVLSRATRFDEFNWQPSTHWYVIVKGVRYDITSIILGACEGDYLKHGELELTVAGTYKISLIRGGGIDDQESDVLMNVALGDERNTTFVVSKAKVRTFEDNGTEFVTFGGGEYELFTLEELGSLPRCNLYERLLYTRKLVSEALSYAKAKQVPGRPATNEYLGCHLLVQFPGIDLVEQLIFIPGNMRFVYRRDEEKDVPLVEFSFSKAGQCKFTIPREYLDYVEQAFTVLSTIDPDELRSGAQIVGRTRLGTLGSDGRIATV